MTLERFISATMHHQTQAEEEDEGGASVVSSPTSFFDTHTHTHTHTHTTLQITAVASQLHFRGGTSHSRLLLAERGGREAPKSVVYQSTHKYVSPERLISQLIVTPLTWELGRQAKLENLKTKVSPVFPTDKYRRICKLIVLEDRRNFSIHTIPLNPF